MIEIVVSIASILVTATGLYFVAKQIADGRRFMKAQFINQLEEDLSALYETYIALLPNNRFQQALKSDKAINESDLIGTLKYLGFFEKIKLIIDNQTVDLSTIDRLFAYRFFLIVNHELIQREILYNESYSGFFNAIFALYRDWHEFRIANNFEIPFYENDLMTRNADLFNVYVKNYDLKLMK